MAVSMGFPRLSNFTEITNRSKLTPRRKSGRTGRLSCPSVELTSFGHLESDTETLDH